MTIEQLAVKVLSKLGVYQKSALDPEDLQNVTDGYNGVWYILNDDGLVTWAITDEDIPDRFQIPLITLIAGTIASFYNIPETDPRTMQAAVNTIRRQLASGQPTETVEAEYF